PTINSSPNSQWPTIASSSIAFYHQTKIPDWHNSILITSLKQDRVYRIKPDLTGVGTVDLANGQDTATIFRGDGNRIRRITIAPSGLKFYVARDASAPINGGTIMEYTYTGVTLPVEFISFKGEVLPSGQVSLVWEAVTDNLHDYFEVERSSNGVQFASIGRGPEAAPFSFIDVAPFSGSNYYRVKQVDLDGTVTYSTVIHIITNAGRLIVSAFPNPTSDVINVTIRAAEADRFSITLTDLNGRTV